MATYVGRLTRQLLFLPLFVCIPIAFAQEAETAVAAERAKNTVIPCIELPTGELSPDQLKELVPDSSGGRVFIRWRTETQDDNYGFNIYRSDSVDGPYKKINRGIIPGEGSTNIPKDYCYMDTELPREAVFFYYIESVSNAGVAEVVEGTKGTRVKVKTVEEEREWIRKKAAGIDTRATQTTATAAATTGAATILKATASTATPAPAASASSKPPANAKPNPLD